MNLCAECGCETLDHHVTRDGKLICPIRATHIPWRRYSIAMRDRRIAELLGSRLMPFMKSVKVTHNSVGMFQIWVRGAK